MDAANRQIQAVKDLEAFIATHFVGGWLPGWLEIAYSGRQARQIIERGHLAVVIGIEVDDLFNCSGEAARWMTSRTNWTPTTASACARSFPSISSTTPSAAPQFTMSGLMSATRITGQWFNVRDCSSEGIEFRFQGRNDPLTSVATTVFGLDPAPPYPGNGHGNTVGLSPLCD